ncbi:MULTISPECIES: TetR/AcrR family transcriptional regulator [Sphingobium]|uniref:TetR/AcrR family transcriptional regulator n=1 Tax=Sphingobium TaxID=165695 RepID=UPI00159CA7C6|nr:TetR/AcrR family transcriptional regulator [Sphingobium sp. 15-1]
MRADAKKNYDHLLVIARDVISEQGANASLRDIARKADVGLATLYRHFPSREALINILLSTDLDALTNKAEELESSEQPGEGLVAWFRSGVDFFQRYRGVTDLMAAADADPASALYKSCKTMRSAGTRLLARAQHDGKARTDLDGADLFALIAAAGWLRDQSSFAHRSQYLTDVIARAILTDPTKPIL